MKTLAVATALALAPLAPAQTPPPLPAPPPASAPLPSPTLTIGGPAPALPTDLVWLKGPPVTRFQPGRTYALEFWRPGDPASRRALPLLVELQALHRDHPITILPIAVPDNGGQRAVQALLDAQSPPAPFPVAFDPKQSAARAFMQAAAQDALPTVFVIDAQGRLVWIGHPLDGLDRTLAAIASGTFDLPAAAAEFKAQAEADAKAAPLARRAESQFLSGDTEAALRTLDDLVALDPARLGDWALQKFAVLLLTLNQPDRAAAYARAVASGPLRASPRTLGAMAWMVLTEPGVQRRDLPLARDLAAQASELTKGQDAVIQDTLARALFDSGKVDDAVAAQTTAVRLAALPSLRAEYQRRLDEYTAARAPKPAP